MRKLFLDVSIPKHSMLISGNNILEDALKKIHELVNPQKIAIIVDEVITNLHKDFYNKITSLNKDSYVFIIRANEDNKSSDQKQEIENFLFDNKFSRNDLVIALGGGITSDLAGFIASNFKRGIPWVIIPTTLLSMVDASIGGKVAINTDYGKNTLGSFHIPFLIISETKFLKTLSIRELKSGIAEWLKSLLLLNKNSFSNLIKVLTEYISVMSDDSKRQSDDWDNFLMHIDPYIFMAQEQKWHIVEKDPEETTGLREILNYGHTLAHAIEKISNYEYTHGEAVAIGIQFANFISYKSGIMEYKVYEDIANKFAQCNLLKPLPNNLDIEKTLLIMKQDKKNKSNEINFVLLKDIGEVATSHMGYSQPYTDEFVMAELKDFTNNEYNKWIN